MNKTLVLAIFMAFMIGPTAHAQITASVNWGAQDTSGLGDKDGIPLDLGDLVMIGTFNLSDSEIRNLQYDLPALKSAFVEYGIAFIGDDGPTANALPPGYWNALTTRSTEELGIAGDRIYVWGFNESTAEQATQHGIFTDLDWVFPPDPDALGESYTIDLNQVDVENILIGGFGDGLSSDGVSELFNLAPVPEPASTGAVFALFCLIGLAARHYGLVKRGSH